MRFLYRVVILAIIAVLCLYLIKYPFSSKTEDILSTIENPLIEQYPEQEGIARSYLSQNRRYIYDAMYYAVDTCSDSVSFAISGYTEADIENVLISILNDCPQFFYMDYSKCSFTVDENGVNILLNYLYGVDDIQKMKTRVTSEVDALVSSTEAQGYLTEYEKAVYVHDAIAVMCEYDSSLKGYDIHNVYGTLVGKKAVCDGYAHSLQLILKQLGIECHYVTGEARGPNGVDGHAWNIAKLDGIYTIIDLTWNDIDSYMFESFIAPSGDITSHIFFGISDEELKQTHKVDDSLIYPLPEAVDMNWFMYNGLEGKSIESISDRASDILVDNISKTIPYVEIRITDQEVFREFFEEFSPEIIDKANEKLEERGIDKRFKSEMNCFVTYADKGCILIVVELGATYDETDSQ